MAYEVIRVTTEKQVTSPIRGRSACVARAYNLRKEKVVKTRERRVGDDSLLRCMVESVVPLDESYLQIFFTDAAYGRNARITSID